MDSRLYFVLGDLFSNVLVGLVAGWFCALIIGEGWNMFLAMFFAMLIGMVVGMVLFFPLGMLFGAMEVMLPTMFGGMFSGMVVGMWAAMMPMSGSQSVAMGAVCGLIAIVTVWILNNAVRGVRSMPEKG